LNVVIGRAALARRMRRGNIDAPGVHLTGIESSTRIVMSRN
jgi:hypothetical protein